MPRSGDEGLQRRHKHKRHKRHKQLESMGTSDQLFGETAKTRTLWPLKSGSGFGGSHGIKIYEI